MDEELELRLQEAEIVGLGFEIPAYVAPKCSKISRLSTKSVPVPKVEFREEVANVALPELLEQRGLSEGRYVANVVDGKGTSL